MDAKRKVLLEDTNLATQAATLSATTRQTEFETAQAVRSGSYDEFIGAHTTDLTQLKKTYNDFMALQAPVTYWQKKARVHAIMGGVFGAITLVFLGCYLWASVSFLPKFITLVKAATATADGAVGVQTAQQTPQSVPVYVALFAVALIGIWLMRILIRLTLSHVHLGTDAKHRSVSVLAYLALLRNESKAIGDDERKIILTQLFRPASDGLVKDDAMPPTLFERLTK